MSALVTAGAAIQSMTVAPEPVRRLGTPLIIAGDVLLWVAYVLARRGRLRATISIIMFLGLTLSPAINLVQHDQTAFGALMVAAFLLTPVITSTALLPSRGVIAISGLAFLVLMATLLLGEQLRGQAVWVPAILFLCTTSVLVVASRHRDALEQIRQLDLQRRNQELQHLRDSLEDRVAERTRDIARAYNELKENQKALIAAEKMAVLGRLTAGIAHEMNSPLSAVLASVYSLTTLVDEYGASIGDATVTASDHREIEKEMRESVHIAQLATNRAVAFVRGIKAQTRVGVVGRREYFDASAVVRDSVLLLNHQARAARCTVVIEAPEQAMIEGDAGRLAQAITNLASNAIDATGDRGGGEVKIDVVVVKGHVVIEVGDQGTGIPDLVMPFIFEPLFTTKPHGRGTGLGLSITKEVVEQNFRGTIHVDTSTEGTKFRIELPAREGVSHAA